MNTWTITAPEACTEEIITAITKLNRRAKRLDMAPLILESQKVARIEERFKDRAGFGDKWIEVGSERHKRMKTKVFNDGGLTGVCRRILEFVVVGEIPALMGWTPVAVLDRVDNGCVIRSIPNHKGERMEVPKQFARVDRCDHCNKSRKRNELVVLHSTTLGFITVGKTCLKDFCPDMRNPERVMAVVRDFISLVVDRDWDEHSGRCAQINHWKTEDIVALSCACVRKDGYRKSDQYSDVMSTGQFIRHLIIPPPIGSRGYDAWKSLQKEYKPTEDDLEKSREVIEFAKSIEGETQYAHNLRTLAAGSYVASKHIGILGSAVAAYNRNNQQAASDRAEVGTPIGLFKARKEANNLTHVGEVKKRLTLGVTITGVHHFDGQWGTTSIVRMVSDEGNQLVWFASGCRHFSEGVRHEVKATVKKHDTDRYNHQPVTVVTRVSFPVEVA